MPGTSEADVIARGRVAGVCYATDPGLLLTMGGLAEAFPGQWRKRTIRSAAGADCSDWGLRQSVDYASVTRSLHPTSERTVISVAGIESYGTLAAGEFVTGPEYLGAALVNAPKDWRRKNIEFVLGTKVVEGTAGPPTFLTTYYW